MPGGPEDTAGMAADPKCSRFDALSPHAGQRPGRPHGSRAVPIYQTTS